MGSGQLHDRRYCGAGGGACPVWGPQTSIQPALGQRQQNSPGHPGYYFKSLPGKISHVLAFLLQKSSKV